MVYDNLFRVVCESGHKRTCEILKICVSVLKICSSEPSLI